MTINPAPILTFFHCKDDVGQTTIVYHVAHMLAKLGQTALVFDLDPQAALTSALFSEEQLDSLWSSEDSVAASVAPCIEHGGELTPTSIHQLSENLLALPGDPALGRFEERLSWAWSTPSDPAALRATTAFSRLISEVAAHVGASVVLVDAGSGLSALSRAVLLAADALVVPLTPELSSLRSLQVMGPTLQRWREEWRCTRAQSASSLPEGAMRSLGYVLSQRTEHFGFSTKVNAPWSTRLPKAYSTALSDARPLEKTRLGTIRDYRSLMPLAQELRRPIFTLKPTDGAIGEQFAQAKRCGEDFEQLAKRLIEACASF